MENITKSTELHTFIERILHIGLLVYFNRSFKLWRDCFEENDLIVSNFVDMSNDVTFFRENVPMRDIILYAHCYDIQLAADGVV